MGARFQFAWAAFVWSVCAFQANASLIGTTATCATTAGTGLTCDKSTAQIGSGSPEFWLLSYGVPIWSIDISASSAVIRMDTDYGNLVSIAPSYFMAVTLGGLSGITGATLSGELLEFTPPPDPSRLTFDSTSLTFDFGGSTWKRGSFIQIDVQQQPPGSGPAIPKPGVSFPISDLPNPAQLIPSWSQVVNYLANTDAMQSAASFYMRSVGMDPSVPHPSSLKATLGLLADDIEFSLGSTRRGAVFAGAFYDASQAASVEAALLAYAQGTMEFLPDALPNTQEAVFYTNLVTYSYEIATGSLAEFLFFQNLDIYEKALAPELRRFASDPPDSNYRFVVEPQIPVLAPVTDTGDARVDDYLTRLQRATIEATAFLSAFNRSFDRYAGAYDAGDAESATLQFMAMVTYWRNFIEAMRVATLLIEEAPTFLALVGFSPKLDYALIASLRDTLAANGLPEQLRNFYLGIGYLNADIDAAFAQFLAADISLVGYDFFASLAQVARTAGLALTSPGTVSEPATLGLVGLGLLGLGLASRGRRLQWKWVVRGNNASDGVRTA